MDRKPLSIRIAKIFYRLAKPFIPAARRYYVRYQSYKIRNAYHAGALAASELCFVEKPIDNEPLISVVVPVYNPGPMHLTEMVYSIINQHYQNWELILVNASSEVDLRRHTEAFRSVDTRIKIVDLQKNRGISSNTNEGIKRASGEYIAFSDHDDLLHPCALHSIAEALQNNPKPELVYTDEDKITADSSRFLNPHIKPDWSIDTLRNVNFVTHLTVVRKTLLEKVGGLRGVTDGSQDYDLLLRIWDECSPTVMHVPRILYHWRQAEGSTADLVANKDYIIKAGTKALEDHIKRIGLPASAEHITGKPGYYKVDYHAGNFSIIVGPVSPIRQAACALWLKKLLSYTEGVRTELIIGTWFEKFQKYLKQDANIKFVESDEDYWQHAVHKASFKTAVCFKSAALPKSKDGLIKLASAAADPEHTAIAPPIVDKNLVILGGGIVMAKGLPKVLFEGYKLGTYTWFLDTDWVRRTSSLSTEVIAAPTKNLKDIFKNYDYSEAFSLAGSDLSRRSEGSNYLFWAHTPFEELGPLWPTAALSYQTIEPFRFVPSTNINIYDWWKKGERDEP